MPDESLGFDCEAGYEISYFRLRGIDVCCIVT
jgi:hypothetical protein